MRAKELKKAFNGREVRVIVRGGVEWFVARDVCAILGLENVTKALYGLDDDEKMTLTNSKGHSGQRGGAQFLNAVNESGLYALIFKSRKEEARAFRKWVTSEVLPSIRKTGKYDVRDIKDKSTEHRNMVTAQWQRQGVESPSDFGRLTREEYRQLYGDAGKKKAEMDRRELLKLSAFEALESWKLSEMDAGALGFGGCKDSIAETAVCLGEVKRAALLRASA